MLPRGTVVLGELSSVAEASVRALARQLEDRVEAPIAFSVPQALSGSDIAVLGSLELDAITGRLSALGLWAGHYADALVCSADGRYVVSDIIAVREPA